LKSFQEFQAKHRGEKDKVHELETRKEAATAEIAKLEERR
jgi:hypothetical protein